MQSYRITGEKDSLNTKMLAVGILFLFIFSSVGTVGLKHNSEQKDIETSVTEPVTSGGPMNSSWPMKCHDARHTSQSPYSTADNPYVEKWNFRSEDYLGGTMESSAIIGDDGTIYFGTMGADHKLYALYPDGTKKWSYEVGLMIWSTPAIAEDGTIYVASWDQYLHAVYPNGAMKWQFHLGGNSDSSPAIGDDGTTYLGSTSSFIYAVNPNGTEKWRYQTGGWTMSNPAIGDDGTIFIGSEDGYLYAMYPNGTLRWRFGTGAEICGHPSIANDGTIYIPSWDDFLYAIYPNGTLRWKTHTGWGSSGSAAITDDGTIYLFTDIFRAFYPTNGTIKWSLDLGDDGGRTSPAISSDGTIYTSNDDGKCIIAIHPDGHEIWRKQISNLRVESSPIIGEDGTIYVGSSYHDEYGYNHGYLHAFGELDPDAPKAPSIDGEIEGEAGVEYDYTFCSIDPNGNDVFYYIEWGDGEFEDWIGPYESGEEVIVTHTWDEQDTYTIKARAKDTNNLWGPWGELEVSMPVNQPVQYPLLELFRERFPLLYQLFMRVLEVNPFDT